MSPIDTDVVQKKLELVLENLVELETIHKKGLQNYKKTKNERKLAERYIQETIEGASDLNSHLLTEIVQRPPEDYHAGFIKMGEIGVIPTDLAQKLAPAGGLRNRIVHQYDKLDHDLVFQGIADCLKLFPQYVAAIRKYVKNAS